MAEKEEELKEAAGTETPDDFGAAFEELAGKEVLAEAPPEKADNPPEAPPSDEAQPTASEEPPAEEAPPEPDYKKLLEEETQRRKSLEGMYNGAMKELETLKAKPPETPPEQPASGVPADLAEEIAKDEELSAFLTDYDYLAKPIQKLVSKLVERTAKDQVAPVAQATNELADAMHFGAITSVHPDFEKLRDAGTIKEFVEKAPEAERPELQRIYDSGNAQEVIGLVSRVKEAAKAAADNSRQKRITDLATVRTGKPAVTITGGNKAEDFDGAWDEAEAASRQRL